MAPNKFPCSVRATESILKSSIVLIMVLMVCAPSNRLLSEWLCKCINSLFI